MNKQDNLNFDEMLVHVPLCTHPNPQKILLVGCPSLAKQIKKHHNIDAVSIDDNSALIKEQTGVYDIIITRTKVDPKEVHRVLNKKGLAAIESKSYWEDFGILRKELFEFAELFNIAMPYKVEGYVILEMRGNIFVSKKYHPTADMILHKIDLLDGLVYYNSDNHIASFVLPKGINEELLPIMKK